MWKMLFFLASSCWALGVQGSILEKEEAVLSALEDFHVPGLAVAIVQEGELLYAKGFGFADREQKRLVSSSTVFPIGSCTKGMTAFALGLLVEEGVLDWDTPVVDVLPEFRLWDPFVTQAITIRDLLTHRSGLPRHDFAWYNAKISSEELLYRLRYLEPSCGFRERYQYNNLTYFVAGQCLARGSGMSWQDFFASRIFGPLGMKEVSFSVEDLPKSSSWAVPYVYRDGALYKMEPRNISLIGSAGAVNASVDAMSLWMRVLLQQGAWEGKTLLSSSFLQEMFSTQVAAAAPPEEEDTGFYGYGLGWSISSHRGEYLVSHDGGTDGYTSVIALLPQRKIGIVVLANANITPLPRLLAYTYLDQLLSLPPVDWFAKGRSAISKKMETNKHEEGAADALRKKGTKPSHPLGDFAGEYSHPGYGTLRVSEEKGKICVEFHGVLLDLGHWHYDTFVVEREREETYFPRIGAKITFHTNAQGEVDRVSFPLEPKVEDIVFTKKPLLPEEALLRKFLGTYEKYGYHVEIVLREQGLCALVPGYPIYCLFPTAVSNEFGVGGMMGCTVRFVLGETGEVKELLLMQPYGAAWTATPVR